MLFDWEKAIRADPQKAARVLWGEDIRQTMLVLASMLSDPDLPPEMRHRATTLNQHTDHLMNTLGAREPSKKFDLRMLLDTMTATRALHAETIDWTEYVLEAKTASGVERLSPEEKSALYESWRLGKFGRNIGFGESPED